jgi:hypothetical protein
MWNKLAISIAIFYSLGMSSHFTPAPALASVVFDTGATHSGLTVSPSPSLLVIFGKRKLITSFYSIVPAEYSCERGDLWSCGKAPRIRPAFRPVSACANSIYMRASS